MKRESQGPGSPENTESDLESVRQEVVAAAQASRARGGARFSEDFDPMGLEQEDLLIVQEAKRGRLLMTEFNRWKMKVMESERKLTGGAPLSHSMLGPRGQLMGFLGDVLELDLTKKGPEVYRFRKDAFPK